MLLLDKSKLVRFNICNLFMMYSKLFKLISNNFTLERFGNLYINLQNLSNSV